MAEEQKKRGARIKPKDRWHITYHLIEPFILLLGFLVAKMLHPHSHGYGVMFVCLAGLIITSLVVKAWIIREFVIIGIFAKISETQAVVYDKWEEQYSDTGVVLYYVELIFDGKRKRFNVDEKLYSQLNEGDRGVLHHKLGSFVDFKQDVGNSVL